MVPFVVPFGGVPFGVVSKPYCPYSFLAESIVCVTKIAMKTTTKINSINHS